MVQIDINKIISEACSQVAGGIENRFKSVVENAVSRNHAIIEYGDDYEIDWKQVWKEVISELNLTPKQIEINEIKNGCGKEITGDSDPVWHCYCKEDWLCKECKVKLDVLVLLNEKEVK